VDGAIRSCLRQRAPKPRRASICLHAGDHVRNVLVQLDAELFSARGCIRETAAAKARSFSFFVTDFGVNPSSPVGRTYATAVMKPASSSTAKSDRASRDWYVAFRCRRHVP
jgi:hypothetical protein